MFTVVVTRKGGTSQTYEFDEELISIGRVQGNEIVLPLGNVSKRHAILEYKNNQFSVTDLDSTNGTYINGRRIHEANRVFRGDRIYVGDYIVTLEGHAALERADEDPKETGQPEPSSTQSNASSRSADAQVESPTLSSAPPPPIPVSERVRRPRQKASRRTDQRGVELVLDMARETIPNVMQGFRPGEEELAMVLETIIDHVTREIKRIDRAEVPTVLDPGTAGRVRLLVEEFVEEYAARGKLHPTISKAMLKGRAYRSIVDLGPLAAWLDDSEISMIRIESPSRTKYLKNGQWTNAASGFASKESEADILRCLSAGRRCFRDEVSSMTWFHLEEGYLAFTSLSGDRQLDDFAYIDKTAAIDPQSTRGRLPSAVRERLEEALNSKKTVAVVGADESARLSIVSAISSFIPESEFSLIVDVIPPLLNSDSHFVRLSAAPHNAEKSAPIMARVLYHAEGLQPSWLVVTGGRTSSLGHILSSVAKRAGSIVELPLAAISRLDMELCLALRAGGMMVDVAETGKMFGSVFDLFVVAGRDRNGFPRVDRILEGTLSASDRWLLKVVWDEKKSK